KREFEDGRERTKQGTGVRGNREQGIGNRNSGKENRGNREQGTGNRNSGCREHFDIVRVVEALKD
ncbi:MAG: hypothetical protein IJH03_00285, partial [Clostridia bacterium]|nr:hypothetical protein [Clostridia bacterium]